MKSVLVCSMTGLITHLCFALSGSPITHVSDTNAELSVGELLDVLSHDGVIAVETEQDDVARMMRFAVSPLKISHASSNSHPEILFDAAPAIDVLSYLSDQCGTTLLTNELSSTDAGALKRLVWVRLPGSELAEGARCIAQALGLRFLQKARDGAVTWVLSPQNPLGSTEAVDNGDGHRVLVGRSPINSKMRVVCRFVSSTAGSTRRGSAQSMRLPR